MIISLLPYWNELVWAAVVVLDLAAIGALLYRSQGVERSLAWIFAIIAFPGLGAIVYFLIANPHIKRTTRRRRRARRAILGEASLPTLLPGGSVQSHVFALAAKATGLEPTGGNRVDILAGDETAFAQVEAALRQASQSIWAEYYIIRRDETGYRFLDLLAEKARQGVEVRLIYDAIGSIGLGRHHLKALTAAGGHCVEFLPLNPLRKRWSVHLRNHRKLIVIDGRIAFTGGMNVGDEYSGRARRRGTLHFSDTHLRLAGPCVDDLEEVFAEDWRFAAEETLALGDNHHEPPAAGDARVAIVPSGPDQSRNASQLSYFAAIAVARGSIYLTSPYFIPDEAIICALVSACLKGVVVRILVPAESDVMLVGPASRSYYRQLLEAGARIYEYKPAMLHAKTMVVDDELAFVGSANLDMRSFRLNFEVGAMIDSPTLAIVLNERFTNQLAHSQEIDLDTIARWPTWKHLAHGATRLFSPLL